MNIELVGVADIDKVWPHLAPLVVKCIETGPTETGVGEVWAQCRSGKWLVLVAVDGAGNVAGLTIWRFAGNEYFECVLLSGHDMSRWLPQLLEVAINIAKIHGCRGLGGTCRPGLMRLLQRKYLPRAKLARVQFISEFEK